MFRLFALLGGAVLLLGLLTAAPVQAADVEKNVHSGTFVSAAESSFTIDSAGAMQTFTLAADGKCIGPDGKDCKLADLKKGEKVKVTTKEGDAKTAMKVECAT